MTPGDKKREKEEREEGKERRVENRSAPDFKGLNANYHDGGEVGISRPLLDGQSAKIVSRERERKA